MEAGMSDYDRHGVTPLKIVAALIGLGLLGRRGQRMLKLIRRVTKWGLFLCIVGFALTVYRGAEEDKLLMMGCFLGAFVFAALWCYAAFAQWLTREDEEEVEG
jgi:uncharacterized membrane protein